MHTGDEHWYFHKEQRKDRLSVSVKSVAVSRHFDKNMLDWFLNHFCAAGSSLHRLRQRIQRFSAS